MTRLARAACCGPTELVRGVAVYPGRADLAASLFWLCRGCGAFVGCHPNTTRPLGKPATPLVRRARQRAHDAFDPLWRGGAMSRSEAYAWLARELGRGSVHIGELDAAECSRVVRLCLAKPAEPR